MTSSAASIATSRPRRHAQQRVTSSKVTSSAASSALLRQHLRDRGRPRVIILGCSPPRPSQQLQFKTLLSSSPHNLLSVSCRKGLARDFGRAKRAARHRLATASCRIPTGAAGHLPEVMQLLRHMLNNKFPYCYVTVKYST